MLNVHSGAAARTVALFIGAAAVLGAQRASAAANFSASPLALELRPGKIGTSLTLGNQGSAPVTVQAELVSWNQDSGEDTYGPANGLVVTPPIFRIDAGASQVVRAGLLKRAEAPAREQAYRLRVIEVPPDGTVTQGAIATVLQLSFPLFVLPADRKAAAKLEFSAEGQPNGDLRLRVANSGAVHGKITRLSLVQGGTPVAERGTNFYVLAGARRELTWTGALKQATGAPLELRIKLDARKDSVVLTVAPAPTSPTDR